MLERIFLIITLALVAACSSNGPKTIDLTIYSEPEGATIIENGKVWGQAPVTVRYTATKTEIDAGYKKILPISAKWKSGATALMNYTSLGTKGSRYEATIRRPANTAGLSTDLEVASNLKSKRAAAQLQKEIAKAAKKSRKKQNQVALGLEMMRTGRLPGSSGSNNNQSGLIKRKTFLQNSYTQGLNRYCIYDDGTVVNVGGGFCRASTEASY